MSRDPHVLARRALLLAVLAAPACKRSRDVRPDPLEAGPRTLVLDVVPGVRIGPVRLGMHEREVVEALGKPTLVEDDEAASYRRLRYVPLSLDVALDHDVVNHLHLSAGFPGSIAKDVGPRATAAEVKAALGKPLSERVIATALGPRELNYRGMRLYFWKVTGLPNCTFEGCGCDAGVCTADPLKELMVFPAKD